MPQRRLNGKIRKFLAKAGTVRNDVFAVHRLQVVLAELADASDFAHGELTIVLLKANVPYAIGEKSADEVLIVDENNKILWQNNWGTRQLASGFTMAKFMGEIEDEDWMISLGLSNVEAKESKSGDIYNLQGMKVAQPTKGIYIQNGKKYIVK